ncbi:activating transcription factor 7-interacting protein 1 [Spea bombifrons]|uniref:activating transcription factor 7-interacting protein 1 n=1 Tax=Spea bombifrons TaxID=233779 RepID=UPI002349E45E|nr:activating transcription factor 7-interacting protein 1 [Spea bombifrons]
MRRTEERRGDRRFKMETSEEPQKKVFKARKTMKASDRQQLEAVHKAKEDHLKPTELKLLNGNHENGDSDINSSYRGLDYVEEKKELNGMIVINSDPREVPVVKLSDIKGSLRNTDQVRDLKLKLDLQPSDSITCKENESGEDMSKPDGQAYTDSNEQCKEKSFLGVDQNDLAKMPVEEEDMSCDTEISMRQPKLSVSDEEESHIVLEGIHELEDESPEEDDAEREQDNIELLPDKEVSDNKIVGGNVEGILDSPSGDFDNVDRKQDILKEELQNKFDDKEENKFVKTEVCEEEMSGKQISDLLDEANEAKISENVVAQENIFSEKNKEISDTALDRDTVEEAITSSMEVDQNFKAEGQKSTSATEIGFERTLSELQTGSGLESLDNMETDEIIPILEKLAPVEDELQCFSKSVVNTESDLSIDEDKAEHGNTSPSKQESSETLPSEAFLVLSDEEEPCDIPAAEEKATALPDTSMEKIEEPSEKETGQKKEAEEDEQEVEKSDVSRRKRSKSEDLDCHTTKKRRYEGDEYEAELQVKITAGDDLNKKLQKVIEKMLDEKLTVLQCAVFDKTLADLKTRVEKLECKKHENVLHAIQAKISRLTKRFGAAKEDLKKRPEQTTATQPSSPRKSSNDVTPSSNTAAHRNSGTVRQMLESKRNVGETTTSTFQSSTAVQPSLPSPSSISLRSPSTTTQISANQSPANTSLQGRTPPDWKLIQQKINASSIGGSQTSLTSQSKPSASVTSTPVMTSVIPAPSSATVVGNTQVSASSTQSMSVSLQSLPVILHVPVAMPSQSQILQGTTGTLVTNQQSGNVEFISVQNQTAVSSLTKTTPVSLAANKPINSPSMPSPGIQRNSPASSVASTLAVQAVQTHSVAQLSRQSLPPLGTSGIYSQANSRASLQLKAGFSSPSTESPTLSRTELQTSRTPVAETSSKRAPETTTLSGKPGGGVIDLTLDDEDMETTSQDPRRSLSGTIQSSQITGRTLQQPNTQQIQSPTALSSQATIHVLPTAQTTVNVTQRPGTLATTRAPAPRLPNNQQMVYTTSLPTVPGQTTVRNTLMQNQNLRQVSPQTGGLPVRMPQTTAYVVNNGMSVGAGPQLTVHHRPPQEPARPIHPAPLPEAPQPQRLPPEASATSLPQKPHLKLARVQSQNGIVLSWSVLEVDRTCAVVDSYHLYAYHEDPTATSPSQWKKIGEVKALPLPMACTLTQFVSGSKYYFAVRAKDVYGRFGPFCDPQSTDVISTQNN